MNSGNALDPLRTLPLDVLAEVVREGEATLTAQMTVALASDQRALTLAGILLTASTALFGGAAALAFNARPDLPLTIISGGLGLALLTSGGLAVGLARPAPICLPGNAPENWLPERWDTSARKKDLTQARVEQATVLQSMIIKNRASASTAARGFLIALWISYSSMVAGGISLGTLILNRSFLSENSGQTLSKIGNTPKPFNNSLDKP